MSAYIKLSTNEYPRHIGDIQLDKAGMADYAPVKWVDAPTINSTQCCFEGSPVQVDNEWQMVWIVRDLTAEEIEQAKQYIEKLKNIPMKNNRIESI